MPFEWTEDTDSCWKIGAHLRYSEWVMLLEEIKSSQDITTTRGRSFMNIFNALTKEVEEQKRTIVSIIG